MSETVAVRPIARSDHDTWLPLWEGYNRFYKRTAAPEVTAMTWSRFFDAYEPVHALVAEVDGAVVGIVHYIFHRNTSMIGPTCYLQDLFTAPAARGRGVGRALIEAVYDAARSAGAGRVYWMTHETNRTAMRLYDQVAERPGFLQYRRNL